MKRWILRGCKCPQQQINENAKQLNLPISIARLLAVRGYDTPQKIKQYFSLTMESVHQPELMKDMISGCQILLKSIQTKQKIVVFGDYDADGITSTSILTLALRRLGGNVDYYIPARETEGYGLNNQAIINLAKQGVEVLLTCDNGISAAEQVALAKELGMTVVIADHHEVPFIETEKGIQYILPAADAIINPKQADCSYPFKSLCAATIAYKMTECLYRLAQKDWQQDQLEYLSLSTVATICDIMDLVDENRAMVKYGLSMLQQTPNIGLQALLEVNGLLNKKLGTYHIGFIIGPCINASGRLELADIAVNLFLSTDKAKAMELAKELVELNQSRKYLSNEGVALVQKTIEENHLYKDKVILVHQPDLHESIAGIVAGRIKEIYYRPTFVLASDKPIVRGSGRSIEGYNMFHALVECSDLLDIFGGHPMAAGLSIPQENIAAFRKALNQNCQMEIKDMVPTTYIDLFLPIERATFGLAHMLQHMEPFGKGNAMPFFGDKEVILNRIQLLGNEKQILKIFFQNRKGNGLIPAILFRKKQEFETMLLEAGGQDLWNDLLQGKENKLALDIIYTVEINYYNNNQYLQIQIKDFRIHQNQPIKA